MTNLEPVESLLPDTLQQSTLQPSSGSGFDKYLKKQSAGLMYAINGTGIDHSIPEGISVLSNTRIKCSDVGIAVTMGTNVLINRRRPSRTMQTGYPVCLNLCSSL